MGTASTYPTSLGSNGEAAAPQPVTADRFVINDPTPAKAAAPTPGKPQTEKPKVVTKAPTPTAAAPAKPKPAPVAYDRAAVLPDPAHAETAVRKKQVPARTKTAPKPAAHGRKEKPTSVAVPVASEQPQAPMMPAKRFTLILSSNTFPYNFWDCLPLLPAFPLPQFFRRRLLLQDQCL
jgi:hypothetical protein